MSYEVRPVALGGDWDQKISDVVSSCFDFTPPQVIPQLKATTTAPGHDGSVYMGAFEGDELIGFNAFIAHHLHWNDRPFLAFQSCWTATSPAHRGKRVFQNIIATAHDHLRSLGGQVMIGWPNPNSEPLFVNKLHYRREASVKRQFPAIMAHRFVGTAPMPAGGVRQNDAELMAMKRQVYGDRLVIQEDGPEDIAWGVRRERATPLGKIAYFDLGGIHWSRPGGARTLVRGLSDKLRGVAYWQIVSEVRNAINPVLGHFRAAETNPFIWFPLVDEAEMPSYDFFNGIRDVF